MAVHPRHTPLSVVISSLVLAALVSACGAGSPASPGATNTPDASAPQSAVPSSVATESAVASSSSEPTQTASPLPEPTGAGEYVCGQPISGVGSVDRAQIADVRVGTHDGYDRIVFEFTGGIPAYRIEIVSPPFTADPSGLPLEVAGDAFLRITLDGGTKVTPDGSLSYAGPTDFQPGFDELVQLVEGGDFEAVSTWYVGLATDPCLNVFTISDAPRLVIDIQH